MLDVTQLGESDLDTLTAIRNISEISFRIPRDRSSAGKRRKARKLLEKKCRNQFSALPTKIAEHLNSLTDEEFFDFLKTCFNERLRRYRTERESGFEKLARFGEKVRLAAIEVTENDTPSLEYRDGTVTIMVNEGAFYIRLKLHGVTEFTEDFNIENLYLAKFDYDEETGKYLFVSDDIDGTIRFAFTEAEAEFLPYDALGVRAISSSPWRTLSVACGRILRKVELAPELLCEREKELLPLIREISTLIFAEEDIKFDNLRAIAKKHGFKKIEKALSKIERKKNFKRKFDGTRILRKKLKHISNIKMWRELYDIIAESQKDYPKATDIVLDVDEVTAVRERVTKIFYDRGYSGVYPCFTKPLKPRKFLCFLSHGMHYIAFGEKRMQARVYFSESTIGIPTLRVCSGTVFYRKNEFVDDFFSFAFDARGRRYYAGSNITEFKSDNEELEKVVNIAAKKAEFEQLTKDEKEIDKRVPYHTHYPISLRTDWKLLLFIILFCTVVGGGLFFIGMTMFSFLIEMIPQGFTAESISEFIKTFPLLYLAAMSFLGFGGLCGLILSVLLYVRGRFTRIR